MFKFRITYLQYVITATHPALKTKFYMCGDRHTWTLTSTPLGCFYQRLNGDVNRLDILVSYSVGR